MRIEGMPYVGGVVRGRLALTLAQDPAGQILLLRQTELQPFEKLPAGFIIVDAAPFAHAVIPLLGYARPTVILDSRQASDLPVGGEILLDGTRGWVSTDPASIARIGPQAAASAGAHRTSDGIAVQLRASVRDVSAARRAASCGADAIGLLRSEYLTPPGGAQPDVDFYRRTFRRVCVAAAPLPVTVRLLDIAPDKLPAWLQGRDMVTSPLGLQGVRLYRREPIRSVWRAQLAALDGLGREFDIRLLIPYLTDLTELREWTGRLRRELTSPLSLAAMAENPAAALQIGDWLEQVDFVALGCNDLMQCLFGADRDRPELRSYLDPYAPALYRFLRQVAVGAGERVGQIQLCGVLPQLPGILPLLLGLGFRVFSVEPAQLDRLRETLAATSIQRAVMLTESVCGARDARQVHRLLRSAADR
jgi:phosphoenolpyruvate-protein kinase (PTS system EI component)